MQDKIATILPIAHLPLIANDAYFMSLSHMYEHREYAEFYARRAREGRYVIMDNSVVEQGTPETTGVYLEKALKYSVSQIVIPDHPLDPAKTVKEIEPFFDLAKAAGYVRDVMAVPHGRNFDEWFLVLDEMLGWPILTIGISRLDYERGVFGQLGRGAVTNYVLTRAKQKGRSIRVHYLGCTNAPQMDINGTLSLQEVTGIDSSLPALCTKHGVKLGMSFRRTGYPDWAPVDLVHDKYDEYTLRQNISQWKSLCAL